MGKYIIIGIVALLVIILLILVITYNRLVGLRNKVKDQWSQVDIQLKKRFDLIPNLVETVKGYAKHESETLENVINARNSALNATKPQDEINANNALTGALGKLFALSESYPELKANQNFLDLQDELSKTENDIAYARQFYNDTVLKYKTAIEVFPTVIVAKMFGFKEEAFFEATETEKQDVKVQF
jgi:LemA protein